MSLEIISKIKRSFTFVPILLKKVSENLKLWEKIILTLSCIIFFCSFNWMLFQYYLKNSTTAPAFGGTFTEGIVGKPSHLNPILTKNNQTDLDISELIYSSLMKYDENNQLVNDIASSWKISEDRLQYTITLKDNVFFHDGKPLTIEDVLFTIQTIQNGAYKSPLELNWMGVKAEKINEKELLFTIKKPYTPFLHNLTFGILPKHIWQEVAPESFSLSEYNMSPIGSGPYIFEKAELKEDKKGAVTKLILKANLQYYGKVPFIEKMNFIFFNSEDEAIKALENKEIMAINNLRFENLEKINQTENQIHSFKIPRYYAIFLNVYQSKIIAEDSVREALDYATCREPLIQDIFFGQGLPIFSPVLNISMEGTDGFTKRNCDVNKAKETLEKADWKIKDYEIEKNGNKEKIPIFFNKDVPLIIRVSIPENYPELVKTLEILKDQWLKAGILLEIETFNFTGSKKVELREYDAFLFGEVLQVDPDPRPYWHSSEKKSPGQNLSNYTNKEVDELLDKGREEVNENVRIELYKKFQLLVNKDIPAIFLYSPYYLYPVSKEIKGIKVNSIGEPSKRYNGIENWYIKEKRILISNK